MADKLKKMESILDELIANATQLNEVSQQVVSKEELRPLQEKQEALVNQLVEMEDSFHTIAEKKSVDETAKKRVKDKLALFEKLNAGFIENLKLSHGIIRFGKSSK